MESRKIIFFDGFCVLCSRFVQWVIKNEPEAIFYFSPIQGQIAENYISIDKTNAQAWSIKYLEDGQIFGESTAVLKIASHLKAPIKYLKLFLIIPKPIRDAVYFYISKRRYKWYGKKEACYMPNEKIKQRFIE